MSVNFFLDNRVKPRSTTCLHRSLGPCHSRSPLLQHKMASASGLFTVTFLLLPWCCDHWPALHRLPEMALLQHLCLCGCSDPRHLGGRSKGHTHTKHGACLSTQAPSGFSVIMFVSFSSDLWGEASVLFFEVILGRSLSEPETHLVFNKSAGPFGSSSSFSTQGWKKTEEVQFYGCSSVGRVLAPQAQSPGSIPAQRKRLGWSMSVISALGRQRQEEQKFKVILH